MTYGRTFAPLPVPHHRAYDLGMPRLSCVLCIFAPRDALILAGLHNPALLADYVAVENQIGHTFRQDQTLVEIQSAIAAGELLAWQTRAAPMLDRLLARPSASPHGPPTIPPIQTAPSGGTASRSPTPNNFPAASVTPTWTTHKTSPASRPFGREPSLSSSLAAASPASSSPAATAARKPRTERQSKDQAACEAPLTTTLEQLLNRSSQVHAPRARSRRNVDDLLFQVAHEIDLAISGAIEPRWTAAQLHRAKMFAATVHIAAQNRISQTELPV